MGYKRPQETTRMYLESAPLPNHGKSYTVVSHSDIINKTHSMLNKMGLKLDRELYRANAHAKVAQGIYHISPASEEFNQEKELGMMFAWTNSYDKSVRFQCAVGGYVMVCHNGMVTGDMNTFARKHTGAADYEIANQMEDQLSNASDYFNRIIRDRDGLRQVRLPKKEQAELIGRLYCDEEILDVSQVTAVKAEMNKPSFDYQADQDNAWAFYNHVTHALKKTHPRSWLSDTQNFHEFIVGDLLSTMGINRADKPIDIDCSDTEDITQMTFDFL